MRAADELPGTTQKIPGETLIGELLDKSIALIPMAVDPHGKWGPLMDRLLHNTAPPPDLRIPPTHPNARRMLSRILAPECPAGILTTANINWQRHRTRQFFGHSYLAPTPRDHTIQQLGLVLTKAFTLHLRNATKKMGHHPNPPSGRRHRAAHPDTPMHRAPPGFPNPPQLPRPLV